MHLSYFAVMAKCRQISNWIKIGALATGTFCGRRVSTFVSGRSAWSLWTILADRIAKIWKEPPPQSPETPKPQISPSPRRVLARDLNKTSLDILAEVTRLDLSYNNERDKIIGNYEMQRIRKCTSIVELICRLQPNIHDDSLKELGSLHKLETLDLLQCSLTGSSLKHLSQLTQLKSLTIGWIPDARHWKIIDVALDHLTKRRWVLIEECHRIAQRLKSEDLRGELQDVALLDYLIEFLVNRNRQVNRRVCELEKICEISLGIVDKHLEDFFHLIPESHDKTQLKERIPYLILQVRTWNFATISQEGDSEGLFEKCARIANSLVDGQLRSLANSPAPLRKLEVIKELIGKDFYNYFKFRSLRDYSPLFQSDESLIRHMEWDDIAKLAPTLKRSLLNFEVKFEQCAQLRNWVNSQQDAGNEMEQPFSPRIGARFESDTFMHLASDYSEFVGIQWKADVQTAHANLVQQWINLFSEWIQFYQKCLPMHYSGLMALEPLAKLQKLHLRNVKLDRLHIPLHQLKALRMLTIENPRGNDGLSPEMRAKCKQVHVVFRECPPAPFDQALQKRERARILNSYRKRGRTP